MRQPQKMTFSMIREAIENHTSQDLARSYVSDELVMINGAGVLFQTILQPEVPYRIDDYRCGLVLQGSIHSTVNLVERHVEAGSMLMVTPGSIGQLHDVSPDFRLVGMGVKPDLAQVVLGGRLPTPMQIQMQLYVLTPSEADAGVAQRLFGLLWDVLHQSQASPDVLHSLLAAQLQLYAHAAARGGQDVATHPSNDRDLCERFIRLVNEHARREHQIGYYASRLCITERYLGTVVKKVSGTSAKEWIDRALVTDAKVMLKHTSRPVNQVADELRFPNPSFFCKYFKRLTGLTPQEYRSR